MKTSALVLLAAFVSLTAASQPPASDPLQGLDFLLGDWRTEPASSAGDTFSRELEGRILVRHARASAGSTTMSMSMTVYDEPGLGLRAIYFDNDGHVIHYHVAELVPGRSVRFESEPAAGPRFRLTYAAERPDRLAVRFEMAPPGASTEYQVIAAGTDVRAKK